MPELRQIGIDLDVHRVIERARRSLSETDNGILRRLLIERRPEKKTLIRTPRSRRSPLSGTVARSRGMWSVDVDGKRCAATNMKDAYRILLLELDRRDGRFLDKFALEGNSRRRFVSQSPEALFASSPHLAREYAQHLTGDWFFDTNLSTEQVSRRARIAARIAGLTYGRDVRLLDNMREI